MMTEEDKTPVVNDIRTVWGRHDDYAEGGWNYASFVIREDLREMEESGWDQATCVREMTDVAINALRALDELSQFDTEEAIIYRLQAHEDKGTDQLVRKYQRLFDQRL